jgi:hypothetical protein
MQDLVEALAVHLGDRALAGPDVIHRHRVVDQHVHPPELGGGATDQVTDRFLVGHVDRDEHRPPAAGPDLVLDPPAGRLVPAAEHDVGTHGREAPCHRMAEALRGAGDDRCPAGQPLNLRYHIGSFMGHR